MPSGRILVSVVHLIRQGHKSPACVANDTRVLSQSGHESSNEGLQMHFGLDRCNEDIADTAQSPGSSVFNMGIVIPHHVDEDGQRLRDERRQQHGVRAVEYRAEGHYSGFAGVPIRRLDITLNELDNDVNDRITDGLCEEREAGSRCHRDIPLVFVGIFLLAREEAENDWNNLW